MWWLALWVLLNGGSFALIIWVADAIPDDLDDERIPALKESLRRYRELVGLSEQIRLTECVRSAFLFWPIIASRGSCIPRGGITNE